MSKIILDHIDKLEIPESSEDYIFDAQMTLARLSQGLFWIYNEVGAEEKLVRLEAAKDNTLICIVNGVLENVPIWITNAFQWYAVSIHNYSRLVGWITTKDSEFAKKYSKKLLPRVSVYRNKVAAHFAITDPWKNDNDADLKSSIMTNIAYAHGYLLAGALSEILTDEEGNEIKSKNETSWSLTKTHEKLIPRFWPNGPLETHQSIKLSAGATRKFKLDWKD